MRARPVLIAPDKFRGTLSAEQAAIAIGRGLAAGGFNAIELLPVADGGEGTLEMMVRARGGRMLPLEAHDPLGRPVTAAFALLDGDKTAVVETAQASGLWRVAEHERDPVAASTAGTGELIDAAVEHGARHVLVAAGG
ncbi:MAG: glycerate kinase, partial [Vicinamibacterales bacterium]